MTTKISFTIKGKMVFRLFTLCVAGTKRLEKFLVIFILLSTIIKSVLYMQTDKSIKKLFFKSQKTIISYLKKSFMTVKTKFLLPLLNLYYYRFFNQIRINTDFLILVSILYLLLIFAKW